MKYIFDFDDVLFNDTAQFKTHMYMRLEKAGVPRAIAEEYYKEVRLKGFSLRNFVSTLFGHQKIKKINTGKLHDEIMNESKNFTNPELFDLVKKLGKNNCYTITYGDKEHQLDKIRITGIEPLFSKIIVLSGSKKEAVEAICEKYKDEEIIFIDDKAKHFEDLDFKKYPNLKTILYTGQNLDYLRYA